MDDIAKLMEQVDLQGQTVRDLKAKKADKSEIDAAVKILLELKAKLPPEPPKEKKVDERAAKKEARRLARMEKQSKDANVEAPVVSDIFKQDFGILPLLQSRKEDRLGRKFYEIKHLGLSAGAGTEVWLRCYVHTVRTQSKLSFMVLREGAFTIQAVVANKDGSKFVNSCINSESVVDVFGKVVALDNPTKVTQSMVEVQVQKLFLVSKATPQLPFQVSDASRTDKEIEELEAAAAKDESKDAKIVRVGLDTRLESRYLDLRTPFSQAVAKVTSTVLNAFRNYLVDQDFIEICTPKLLGGASEGGAEVFKTDYFSQEACLAQSPQLHKQISAACSGFQKVFEVGPVFRAENSNTNRHLCEFTGLDAEMCFKEHYHEILDMFSDLFHSIFNEINTKRKRELEVIREYVGFEDLIYSAPEGIDPSKIAGTKSRTLRIEFKEAIELLRAAGVNEEEQPAYDDLSTPIEKKLGGLVKEKYGVDFYFLDKFPLKPRPFYTMPCPENPLLSNSYDFFIRGQEIMSGAQRLHDAEMLEKRIAEKGIPVESLRFYIDSFKAGALPHGGGGVGLERVVMLFLALPNIRNVRLFPRDPQRLMP